MKRLEQAEQDVRWWKRFAGVLVVAILLDASPIGHRLVAQLDGLPLFLGAVIAGTVLYFVFDVLDR